MSQAKLYLYVRQLSCFLRQKSLFRLSPVLFFEKRIKIKKMILFYFSSFQVDETSSKSFLMSSQVAFKYSTEKTLQKVDF
jgi:hypothetical protein